MEKKYTWHKIADGEDELAFPSNGILEVNVAGKQVCLAKVKDELYACFGRCPHAGGCMADGYLDASGRIVCPLHRYAFDLRNGRNVSGEGYYLKTYPVRWSAEGIFIGIEESRIKFW